MARIILINDEPDLLLLCRLALEGAGHTVHARVGASDVIEVVQQFRPDLIGLDWVLPDMSGEEALLWLKSAEPTRAIPVLVISALHGLEPHVRKLGADGVLGKPFHAKDLLAAVDRTLGATPKKT